MQRISLKNILIVIQRTLDSVDDRMIGHGEEVAYIMYKLLEASNKYSQEEMLRMTILAMFHDIGAYKVEERARLVDIDLDKPMAHAVYGSLFIKYFSPLSDLSPMILGHHLYAKDLNKEKGKGIPKEALLLHLADYIAIVKLNFNRVEKKWIMNKSNEYFLPEHKKLFEIACDKYNLLEKISDRSYIEELYQLFDNSELTYEDALGYIKMLIYAIDFRSETTLLHAISVEELSFQIAKILKLDKETIITIKAASMLHDIGKISIPVEILEKTGKLTPEEFNKIKDHAIIGYRILSDIGANDFRDIATLHHEKLDGSGYPFGLKGDEISLEVRVVAIADIMSALVSKRSYKDALPKEEVISILSDMAENNKIDSEICAKVIENYDFIIDIVRENTKEMVDLYHNIMKEYEEVLSYYEEGKLGK